MIKLFQDSDIKIVGDRPSEDVKREKLKNEQLEVDLSKEDIKKAKQWGRKIAESFIEDVKENLISDEQDSENMAIQRRLLLSFTATVGFDQFCENDSLSGIAEKSFLDSIREADSKLYTTSADTGAFSFYYLAFRRGGDIERRMGQTFAMLCSHDGDPIYQELGEALYCWFLSVVKKAGQDIGIQ